MHSYAHVYTCQIGSYHRMGFKWVAIANCEVFVVVAITHCLCMRMHIFVHADWDTLFKHTFLL